ncbi:RICIN domain-containing protein (plasmid) [Streptomyces uncialis]|uniref:RICIN domain-containing protein n=1 Tax=Streptomyces uncialis TaxID=1048205 RepID=UPI002E327CFD|nr:RICIN domain-containing protein [Streptomyces uncialis]
MSRISPRSRTARGGLTLIALALATLGIAPTAGAAPAAAPQRVAAEPSAPQHNGLYTIRAVHSGKCIGPYGNSTGWDAQLVQQPCDGRPTQQFRLNLRSNEFGENWYSIAGTSGYCWGYNRPWGPQPGGGAALGESARTTGCDRYYRQIAFSFGGNPSAGYEIKQFSDPNEWGTHDCLDVAEFNMNDNAGVVYWTCNQGQNQKFQLLPV